LASPCNDLAAILEQPRRFSQAVTRKDADEYFVILLSDANLDIYGIHPSMLGRILGSDERCHWMEMTP
jgi:hypothetical protein